MTPEYTAAFEEIKQLGQVKADTQRKIDELSAKLKKICDHKYHNGASALTNRSHFAICMACGSVHPLTEVG